MHPFLAGFIGFFAGLVFFVVALIFLLRGRNEDCSKGKHAYGQVKCYDYPNLDVIVQIQFCDHCDCYNLGLVVAESRYQKEKDDPLP